MRCKRFLALFILIFVFLISITWNSSASDVKQDDLVSIVTPGTVARLCPHPNCGQDQHIKRIPKGTTLVVEGIMDVDNGFMSVTWFEVSYKGKRGWISIFDTDKAQ